MTVAEYLKQIAEKQIKNNRKIYSRDQLISHLKKMEIDCSTEKIKNSYADYYMKCVLYYRVRKY